MLLTSRASAAGWPRSSLSRRLGGEGRTRIRSGAWAEPGRTVGVLLRLRAAQLLNPGLIVSHRPAARLWMIETLGAEAANRLEFTDPGLRTRSGPAAGVRIHRIPLPVTDIVERCGLRVTGVPRTLADLLRAGSRDDALVAVESALGHRRVDGVRHAPLTTPAALARALQARSTAPPGPTTGCGSPIPGQAHPQRRWPDCACPTPACVRSPRPRSAPRTAEPPSARLPVPRRPRAAVAAVVPARGEARRAEHHESQYGGDLTVRAAACTRASYRRGAAWRGVTWYARSPCPSPRPARTRTGPCCTRTPHRPAPRASR